MMPEPTNPVAQPTRRTPVAPRVVDREAIAPPSVEPGEFPALRP